MRFSRVFAAVAASAALVLTGCGSTSGSDAGSDGSGSDSAVTTLRVGASPSPHAQILHFIDDKLAKDAGLKLDIVEFTDYVQPNQALASGDLDANFYQTVPYLKKESKERGYGFVPGKPVHLEPLAIYSKKHKDIKEIGDGATIGIISDPVNQDRALHLLEQAGLVEVPQGAEDLTIDKVKKLKKFDFKEVEGPQLVRALQDVDAAVINGNFASEGGLSAADDALLVESPENNPANNVLVWAAKDKDDEHLKKLDELLHSDQVKKFIEDTFKDKSVIPAF